MLEVQNIVKKYGERVAVNDISFTVNKGEIVGLLGPNGAGKSTTMNMITGYLSATEGSVKIDGIDILEEPEKAKKKIGYLPEIPPLYIDMTVEEYLKFVAKIKKTDYKKIDDSLTRIMEVTRILDVKHRIIRNLSKGYKQRVGLAQAIIGSPELLILDEPTVGLDPKQIIEIRSLIKELGKSHTIILSSHILPEVSAVCDRVLIINKGQIVASGTPEELSEKLSFSNNLLIKIKSNEKDEIIKSIEEMPEVKKAEVHGVKEKGTVEILVEAKKDMDIREKIFYKMSDLNAPILMMKNVDLTLEEIFLQVTTSEEEGK